MITKIKQAMKRALNLPLILWPSDDGINNGVGENQSKKSRNGEEYMTTVLQILGALPALVQTILELMKVAKEAFPGDGQSAVKKQTVMDSIQGIVNNDDLWAKVKDLFSKIINMLAFFHFGSSGNDPAPKS